MIDSPVFFSLFIALYAPLGSPTLSLNTFLFLLLPFKDVVYSKWQEEKVSWKSFSPNVLKSFLLFLICIKCLLWISVLMIFSVSTVSLLASHSVVRVYFWALILMLYQLQFFLRKTGIS